MFWAPRTSGAVVSCPACHLFPNTCFVCGAAVTRVARAVGPLEPSLVSTIVDELQRLAVDDERVTKDIADAFEAGHLAAIRAEVTYALANMEQEAGEAARVERNWRFFLARPSGLDPWNRAQFVGLRHMAERRRRRAVGFLATTRRWLQETA